MKSLYKYSNSYFGNGLAKIGLFRIGTLYDYRNEEHKNGIFDSTEGIKSISVEIEKETYETGDEVPANLSHLGIIKADRSSTNIVLEDIYTNHIIDSENLWLWCCSSDKSKSVMNSFEGTDTCVEIFDPINFIRILSNILSIDGANFLGLFEVNYANKNEKWNKSNLGIHPALIKDYKFHPQKRAKSNVATR